MPQEKTIVYLEVVNQTRLLLFLYAQHITIADEKYKTELFIWNHPPDDPKFNNANMHKVMPGKFFIYDISLGPDWEFVNKTRYNPLAKADAVREEADKKIISLIILPTNNHISIEDVALLETMGETVETK